jgi:hypothetical protein
MKLPVVLSVCAIALHGCASTQPPRHEASTESQIYQALILKLTEQAKNTTLIIADSTISSSWSCLRQATQPPSEWGTTNAFAALGTANQQGRPLNDTALLAWTKTLERSVVFRPLAEARKMAYQENQGVLLRFSSPAINPEENCALACYSLGNDDATCWLRLQNDGWQIFRWQMNTIQSQD